MPTEVTRNYVNTPSLRRKFDVGKIVFENGGLEPIAYTTWLDVATA